MITIPFGSVLYETLVNAAGSTAFSDLVLAAADAEAGVDEVFGYWFDDAMDPARIVSAGKNGSSAERASAFVERYHQLDPLAWLAAETIEGEPTRAASARVCDIHDTTYRLECYERPGLAEKISFARRRGSRRYVLNFYRSRDRTPIAYSMLSELAEVVLPLLRKEVDIRGRDRDLPLVRRVEYRVQSRYPALTRREVQVCARTLIGMTAHAISDDLNLSDDTVLTYRRRAYERYRISSAREMVEKILF